MNVREIRRELAGALGGFGFERYDTVPTSPELPAAIVGWPDEIVYDHTLDGGSIVRLRVLLAFSLADEGHGQEELDEAVSGKLRDAIHEHRTTAWRSAHVPRCRAIQTQTFGRVSVLTAELEVDLLT